MYSPKQALNRLNDLDRSFLNPSSISWIMQVERAGETGINLDGEIDKAIKFSKTLPNQWAYAEFLLNLAVLEYRFKRYKSAQEHILIVVDIFPPKSHRATVTLWILGWVEWARSDPYAAYSHWIEARQIYLDLYQHCQEQRQTDQIKFYLDCLKEIAMEMVFRMEELYAWLNAQDPSHLSDTATSLVNGLMQAALKGDSKMVYQQITLLQKVGQGSADSLEATEITVECGMALYLIKNFLNTANTLRQATAGYPPGSHRQAVARWMAGLAQWQVQSERSNAISNWQQAIQDFEGLGQQALRNRNADRAAWYEERIEVMNLALAQKISQM